VNRSADRFSSRGQIEILLILALKSACMARPNGEVAQNRENYDPHGALFERPQKCMLDGFFQGRPHRWTSNRGYIFGGPSYVRYERYKYPSLTSLGLSL
jgi:hypothetical protein